MNLKLKPSALPSRNGQIGAFFKDRRLESGLSADFVAQELGLPNRELLLAYEDGTEPVPLDEIFVLTNLLNVAPNDVLALIYDIHAQAAAGL